MGRMKAGRTRRARLACGRCGQRAPRDLTSEDAEDWSGRYEGGRLALVVCPSCHSPVETAEAELNAAAVMIEAEAGGRFAAARPPQAAWPEFQALVGRLAP